MRVLLGFCLSVLVSFSCFAGAKKQNSTVLADANKMAKAFLAKDYMTYARYSYYQHPGKDEEENLAKMVARHMYDLQQQNNVITGMSFGTPTAVVHTAKQLQCVIPVTMKTHIKGGTITSYTNMIAFSYDNGRSWHFMDMGNKNLETLIKQYPEISPKLTIPAKGNEEFKPDEMPQDNN